MDKDSVKLGILSLMCCIETSLEVVSMLPKVDLCDQLKRILEDQMNIVIKLENEEGFTEEEVIHHCDKCDDIISEIERIRETPYSN